VSSVEDLRRPAHATLYFDLAARAVRGSDVDPDAQAQLLASGEWVAAQTSDLVVVDWPRFSAIAALNDAFLPWLSALDMAKARELPLWCDDVGLRTLAAGEGVSTFGTTDLIAALVETSAIGQSTATEAIRSLREAYAVDLPLDPEWVREFAANEEWRPGPSAFCFARPTAWRDFQSTYALWSELAQSAAQAERLRVAGWVHAAALGIADSADPARLPYVLANLAAKGIALAGFDSEAIAACAARVREVAAAAGASSPVPTLMSTLFDHLSQAVGPAAAATRLLSDHLAEQDRTVVRDLVFGIAPRADAEPT
jgi:DNA-binding transcriptional ArsR family regulator